MLARTHSPKAPNMSMQKYLRTEVKTRTVCEVTEPVIITAAQAQHEGLLNHDGLLNPHADTCGINA